MIVRSDLFELWTCQKRLVGIQEIYATSKLNEEFFCKLENWRKVSRVDACRYYASIYFHESKKINFRVYVEEFYGKKSIILGLCYLGHIKTVYKHPHRV